MRSSTLAGAWVTRSARSVPLARHWWSARSLRCRSRSGRRRSPPHRAPAAAGSDDDDAVASGLPAGTSATTSPGHTAAGHRRGAGLRQAETPRSLERRGRAVGRGAAQSLEQHRRVDGAHRHRRIGPDAGEPRQDVDQRRAARRAGRRDRPATRAARELPTAAAVPPPAASGSPARARAAAPATRRSRCTSARGPRPGDSGRLQIGMRAAYSGRRPPSPSRRHIAAVSGGDRRRSRAR